jgi:hypothetical protein
MTTWLNVKNNAESALSAAITAAVTSLTLVSGEGSKFPSANFNISIDDEILTCSTRSGDVLTVTRAAEGTTAAIHAAGAIVALNVTAGVIQQLQQGTLYSKVISITRDLTAANGDVAYTGVGFQPTAILFISAINGGTYWGAGFADSIKGPAALYNLVGTGMFASNAYGPILLGAAAAYEYATVKSYDADGFTLTWAKNGAPTGTASIYALCLR